MHIDFQLYIYTASLSSQPTRSVKTPTGPKPKTRHLISTGARGATVRALQKARVTTTYSVTARSSPLLQPTHQQPASRRHAGPTPVNLPSNPPDDIYNNTNNTGRTARPPLRPQTYCKRKSPGLALGQPMLQQRNHHGNQQSPSQRYRHNTTTQR